MTSLPERFVVEVDVTAAEESIVGTAPKDDDAAVARAELALESLLAI